MSAELPRNAPSLTTLSGKEIAMAYRVVVFLTCWIALWTGAGAAVGKMLGTPGTGAVIGFGVAVASTFLWPWIIPEPIDNWMDGLAKHR